MSGLLKQAEGLQRFNMVCGFWRSPKYVGLSLSAVGLAAAGVSYCYEHSTDGKLPKGVPSIAAALGLQQGQVKKAMQELIGRTIWTEERDHTQIVGYLEHNPSAVEVRDHRAKKKAAAIKANHARWHEKSPDPDCPLCSSEPDSESDTPTDSEQESSAETKSRGDKRRVEEEDSTSTSSGDEDEFYATIETRLLRSHKPEDVAAVMPRFVDRHRFGAEITHPIAFLESMLANLEKARAGRNGKTLTVEIEPGVFVKFVNGEWVEQS